MVLISHQDHFVLDTHDLAQPENGDEPRLIPESGLFPGCVRAESVSLVLHVVGVMFLVGAARWYALRSVRQSELSLRVAFPVLHCSQERMFAPDFALQATERPLSPRVPPRQQS